MNHKTKNFGNGKRKQSIEILWVSVESVSGLGSNKGSVPVKVSIEALQYVVGHYPIKTMGDIQISTGYPNF